MGFSFYEALCYSLAAFEYELHALIAAYVICLTISEATSDSPAAIFPYGFVFPGIILTQIIRGKSLEMNMKGTITYIQTVRANFCFQFQ